MGLLYLCFTILLRYHYSVILKVFSFPFVWMMNCVPSHVTFTVKASSTCAVFSLEPLAQVPRKQDYGHAGCEPVYPSSSPLFCRNWGVKISCGDHSVWSPEEFTLLKFGLGLVAKFCFRVYSVKAKGSVLAPCVTFVCCGGYHHTPATLPLGKTQ
jgi:hypothetical protein